MKTLSLAHFATLALVVSSFAACTSAPERQPETYPLAPDAVSGETAPFVSHDNYLAMNLPFPPFENLFQRVNGEQNGILRSRGEAHITVITPSEFDVLKDRLTIEDINNLASEMQIEKAGVESVCLGRAQATLDGKTESTYFVVVRSEDLLRLRRAIEKLFVTRGGAAEAFSADHFNPHVTVGYTKRDLFEADGAVKDARSCVAPLVAPDAGISKSL